MPLETQAGIIAGMATRAANPDLFPQRVRLIEGGKLVIPAAMRRELGLSAGDTVVVEARDGELRVRSLASAIARAQAIVRRVVAADRSLAGELIAERRDEAARD